tara:strand:- start:2384 stop:3289 length:906 start_codon:yes stop_codon:yes gene_type:complete
VKNYQAFGLSFESDMDLSPLRISEHQTPDVRIIRGAVSPTGLDKPKVTESFFQTAPNELWLDIPDIARFYVSDGNSVVVDPKTGADMDNISLFLLGSCMGAIMYQRKRLVIHGNAIRFGNECIVVAGASGAGKSTLAAAFVKRGYQVLADDLSVIDAQGWVQPSYPQLKIWRDTANKLDIEVSGLNPIGLQVDKFAYPLREQFYPSPLPLRAVYILHAKNQENLTLQAIVGMGKIKPLQRHSYRRDYIEGLGLNADHVKFCARIANQISLSRIARPIKGFDIDALIELIEGDIEGSRAARE